jgi:hypothetical protein
MIMRSITQAQATRSVAIVTVSLVLSSTLLAQKAKHVEGREMVEQKLEEKYKLSTFTPGRGPIKTGTFVLVQKTGLEMVAAVTGLNATLPPTLSYQDGKLNKTGSKWSAIKNAALKDHLMPIDKGTALIVTKIEAKDDHIAFDVVTADAIEGTFYRAAIRFEFGKGYLDSPDMARIESAIGGLFQIEKQDKQAEGAQGGQQGPPPQGGPAPPPARGAPPRPAPPEAPAPAPEPQAAAPPPPPEPPAPPAPPAAPVEIKMGMTGDQVKAAKGAPTKSTKFGTKEILVYPDVKITLINGKVTNVE